VRQRLKALLEAAAAQQPESSASLQHLQRGRAGAPSTHSPNPPPSQQQGRGEGVGAAALRVKSRLGPNRDPKGLIYINSRVSRQTNLPDYFSFPCSIGLDFSSVCKESDPSVWKLS
jgi:hypothetical protein